MTITLMVLMIVATLLIIIILILVSIILKAMKQQMLFIEELANTSIALYNYDQYYVASHKLILCFLEDHVQKSIQQLIHKEKYEHIQYYQEMLKNIQQMKQMDNSSIEALNDD